MSNWLVRIVRSVQIVRIMSWVASGGITMASVLANEPERACVPEYTLKRTDIVYVAGAPRGCRTTVPGEIELPIEASPSPPGCC